MNENRGKVMVTGNAAAALGCVYAGATVGAWYPITPATSVMDGFAEFCERYRVDPETGKHSYCILQAEDELAAAGMVIGASWMGARAFTPTSGPGIDLMSEFIGLAYYSEVPGVFFDIQRTGPSTGMPTRTQQGDLISLAYASHGDTKHIVLFPANPEECFGLAVQAFDLADRFQTPVFVASDLDIGMNDWMCPRLQWDDNFQPDRGKVLGKEELAALGQFYRYLDRDGDGIAARTYPGVDPRGSYFVRGSGHDKYGAYTEDADGYREVMDRLARKLDSAREVVPAPEVRTGGGSEVAIVTVGSCRDAVLEALDRLREQGIEPDFLRVRGFPFSDAIQEFLHDHERVFVVEQNRDSQLRTLLAAETGVARDRMIPIVEYGGLPLTADFVVQQVVARLAAEAAV
jgi:2-oxoglutarate ferredoxin oxidoreductase subunit alpha